MVTFICTVVNDPDDQSFMVDLFRRYERLMFFTARKYSADLPTQEDVVQETLLHLISRIALLRTMSDGALAGYITAAVRNTAINYGKKQARRRAHEVSIDAAEYDDTAGPRTPTPDELVALLEQRADLAALWQQVPENDRILLEGKYILGCTDEELARQLDCKPDSVRMMLTRARRRAMQLLLERGESHDQG